MDEEEKDVLASFKYLSVCLMIHLFEIYIILLWKIFVCVCVVFILLMFSKKHCG